MNDIESICKKHNITVPPKQRQKEIENLMETFMETLTTSMDKVNEIDMKVIDKHFSTSGLKNRAIKNFYSENAFNVQTFFTPFRRSHGVSYFTSKYIASYLEVYVVSML